MTPGQNRLTILFCLAVIVILILGLRLTGLEVFNWQEMTFMNKDIVSISQHEDKETGYHQDLANLRQKGISHNLKDVDLSNMSASDLLMVIHSYLDNMDTVCRRKLRMGKIGDGGWEVCDDPSVRPRPPCIVYSFGINYDFSFDDDVSKVYGCHVFSFDPTMNKVQNQYNRSQLVHFYKVGLSNKITTDPKLGKLSTFSGIRQMLNHQNAVIDVLKIDIEGSEWLAIPEMIESGQLTAVRQLMIEYHVLDSSYSYLLPKVQAVQAVERAGFKRYYVHKNPACRKAIPGFPVVRTMCYEVYYIRL